MTRTVLPVLVLILAATPALADFPSRYSMRGPHGTTGSLTLEPAGETLIRKRTKVKARLSMQLADADGKLEAKRLEVSGTLTVSGDVLQGELRASKGLGGHLQQLRITPGWQAELSQGMQIDLTLRRGFTTLKLVGRAPLGPGSAANEATITRFYQAFQRKDAAAMAAEYAPDVHFSDRVFPNLHGAQAGKMWAMLCESDELELTFSGVRAGARYGVARWEARYVVFGNPVHNVIDANFEFGPDGKIVRHVDSFDFERWANQALPNPARFVPGGLKLGAIRAGTAIQLHRYTPSEEAPAQPSGPQALELSSD